MKMRRILTVLGKALLLLLFLALTALPAVYMNSVYGYLPVLLVLVLLAASLICLLVVSRSLRVQADGGNIQCRRGEHAALTLKLMNRSLLICPRAAAYIYISDLFGGHDDVRAVRFAVPARDSVEFSFQTEMAHVGCFQVGLDHVELYDFFGLFRKKVPVSGSFSAVVTPRVGSAAWVCLSDEVQTEAAQETKISVVGGTDYTGVRAYVPGDPMKQIHWKLSAHSREYMTKLQESSRQQEFAVILDLTAPELEREALMELNDCLIETALSLVEGAAAEDSGCTLLYPNRAGVPERTAPAGRENDAELVRSLACINASPDAAFSDANQLLRQEGQGQNRGSNVAVVTARPTPELLQELLRVKRQRRSPELYLVVPAQWSSREVENACAPLRQLDEAEIPYTVVSAAKNLNDRGA